MQNVSPNVKLAEYPVKPFGDIPRMDVFALARELNQKTARQGCQQFCDPTLSFGDPIYERFVSLWQNKAGSRSMPAKSEISPRDLKEFLGNIIVAQRVAEDPSCYVFRLIGCRVTEIVGNATGKTIEESAPAENAARWTEGCDLVLDGGQPLRFLGRVRLRGREYLDAENLFVPLANDEGKPSFIMGLCRYTPRLSENEESWEKQIAPIAAGLL